MIMKKFDSLPTNASEKRTFIIYRPGGEWRRGGSLGKILTQSDEK